MTELNYINPYQLEIKMQKEHKLWASAFRRWAKSEGYDLTGGGIPPVHAFVDEKTEIAQNAWAAACNYMQRQQKESKV